MLSWDFWGGGVGRLVWLNVIGLQSTKQFNLEFPHQNPKQFRETTKLEYPLSYGLLKTNKWCAFICLVHCTEAANCSSVEDGSDAEN